MVRPGHGPGRRGESGGALSPGAAGAAGDLHLAGHVLLAAPGGVPRLRRRFGGTDGLRLSAGTGEEPLPELVRHGRARRKQGEFAV